MVKGLKTSSTYILPESLVTKELAYALFGGKRVTKISTSNHIHKMIAEGTWRFIDETGEPELAVVLEVRT